MERIKTLETRNLCESAKNGRLGTCDELDATFNKYICAE